MRPGRAPDGLAQVSFVRRYVLSDHSGYVKLRRDLFRHVKQHLLNSTEAWVYVCMIGEADYRTGVWWGSAGLLASLYRMPERTCRRCLSSLESKGYIKRFHTPHSMLSYAVLINKYEVAGNVAGMYKRLNTELSNTYNDLVYDDVREDGQPVAGEVAGTIKNKEVKSKPPVQNSILWGGYTEDFQKLWNEYPRGNKKREAFKAFQKLKCQNGDLEKIIAQVRRYRETPNWQKENGQYVPHLSTFLNQRIFEDEFE